MFVLAHHPKRCINAPAQVLTCCACQQLVELSLGDEEDTSPSALHLLALT